MIDANFNSNLLALAVVSHNCTISFDIVVANTLAATGLNDNILTLGMPDSPPLDDAHVNVRQGEVISLVILPSGNVQNYIQNTNTRINDLFCCKIMAG
jgi:hypothetical protein